MTQQRRQRMADQLRRRVRRRVRRWTEPADQWRIKVQRWVDAGIVSSTQGEEIIAMESTESATSTNVDARRATLSPVIELFSYVGVVVVGMSAALFLGHYWDSIAVAGHVSVAVMVMVAGLAGGLFVGQAGDAASRRLSGFLRLIGTGGAAMVTAIAIGPSAESRPGLTLLGVGVVVAVVSASLWRNRDRPLQFLSALLGVVLATGAFGTVAHLHATSTEVALLVWFFAIAIGVMSLQMLRPAPTALVVAELGSFVGAAALSFPNHLGGVLLGLLSTFGAVAIGLTLERPLIIVIGVVGFFMFDFRIFSIYLRSADAALGAFVLGLVLVLVALSYAWHASMSQRADARLQIDLQTDAEWHEPW